MGSGKHIKRAIEKYGNHNFIKIINGVWKSQKIAYLIEKWIVDKNFVNSNETFNIMMGGHGGWEHVNKLYPKGFMYAKTFTKEHKRNIGIASTGRKHSEESKEKMRKKLKGKKMSHEFCENLSAARKGGGNPSAKIVEVYNEHNVLQFTSYNGIRDMCQKNHLPEHAVRKSLKTKTPMYMSSFHNKSNKTFLQLSGNDKFIGWYVIKT